MYFVVRRNNQGLYWWRAVGDNNEIMAASELMENKRDCESAIATVKREASDAPIYDRTGQVSKRGRV